MWQESIYSGKIPRTYIQEWDQEGADLEKVGRTYLFRKIKKM